MKVVLFCGGLGLRLRAYSETIPKPMVPIGARPMLWHVMRYYAHFGHTDFVLCLGWKGEVIKRYFQTRVERELTDVAPGSDAVRATDIGDWNITFADTDAACTIGDRLRAVRHHLADEETFLANYCDGLTDLRLPALLDFFHAQPTTASFVSVKPSHSFHAVAANEAGLVRGIQPLRGSDVWINGGYFVFRHEIFRYLKEGEELVGAPFARLIAEQRLSTFKHRRFWACVDTLKDKQALDAMWSSGHAPWEVWRRDERGHPAPNRFEPRAPAVHPTYGPVRRGGAWERHSVTPAIGGRPTVVQVGGGGGHEPC